MAPRSPSPDHAEIFHDFEICLAVLDAEIDELEGFDPIDVYEEVTGKPTPGRRVRQAFKILTQMYRPPQDHPGNVGNPEDSAAPANVRPSSPPRRRRRSRSPMKRNPSPTSRRRRSRSPMKRSPSPTSRRRRSRSPMRSPYNPARRSRSRSPKRSSSLSRRSRSFSPKRSPSRGSGRNSHGRASRSMSRSSSVSHSRASRSRSRFSSVSHSRAERSRAASPTSARPRSPSPQGDMLPRRLQGKWSPIWSPTISRSSSPNSKKD
ncbi:hypothetical protein GOP47_0020352 [Adiantum capillus-veneris]|uniref:Uncharacterized protein n=1 Tax=Adiantum capillus-veneris TaxID=13818 RepID=A0A9D4UDB8_ADICA|nr:hypothetical protein GOP47_0020352 [Adiantum capillus-veneris]